METSCPNYSYEEQGTVRIIIYTIKDMIIIASQRHGNYWLDKRDEISPWIFDISSSDGFVFGPLLATESWCSIKDNKSS